MKNILSTFILIALLSCQQKTTETVSTPEDPEINKLVLQQKTSFDVPGLAVGVIKNGEVVYTKAHGVQGLDIKDSLSTKSLFHMASVSKPFVATAIVQLMEQGKIDLDERLIHYLPYFTMADERYKDITIRHMLNHSSGIPDVEDYEWDKPQYDEGAAERYARSFGSVKLDFSPGEKFNYSNAAFDILCDLISKVSGMTFEDYMWIYIFEPIGMKNSTFIKPDVPKKWATKPHIIGEDLQPRVSKIYPYNRIHAGSSTLHSNVEDMLLWAKMNLNKGIINEKRIYKESSYDLLTSSQLKINDRRSIGLSWFLGSLHENTVVFHQGGDTGYSTFFGFVPEKKSAIVMMANTDYFWSNQASGVILANSIFNDSISWRAPIHLKLKNHILEEGIAKTKEIYFSEKQKSPQQYIVSGNYIDELGYWLLDRNRPQKALELFTFNVELEPEDAGWPDSVADAYSAMDSIALAIQWYKKALKIDPDQDFSRKKLEALLAK
ncbi:serine hydrolase [Spongiimicrobium salis]|uniref:serine hydrolase n=1 Tax=Spongiimicrobium salis TaxID=1667022 RepID=UPI00374C93D7